MEIVIFMVTLHTMQVKRKSISGSLYRHSHCSLRLNSCSTSRRTASGSLSLCP